MSIKPCQYVGRAGMRCSKRAARWFKAGLCT